MKIESDIFLEAHFYSGGLRHTALTEKNVRPEWAPSADRVGFRDEFPLGGKEAIIEFSRMNHNGGMLTWIAVHYKSVDQSFGDRQNHASVGIWLNDLLALDSLGLINGLKKMAKDLAGEGNPARILPSATKFAKSFAPSYCSSLSGFPEEFRGVPFSSSSLLETKISIIKKPVEDKEAWVQAADKIGLLTFCKPSKTAVPRHLICLSVDQAGETVGSDLVRDGLARENLIDILTRLPQVLSGQVVKKDELEKLVLVKEEEFAVANGRLAELKNEIQKKDKENQNLSQQIETSNQREIPAELLRRIEANDKRYEKILDTLNRLENPTFGVPIQQMNPYDPPRSAGQNKNNNGAPLTGPQQQEPDMVKWSLFVAGVIVMAALIATVVWKFV